MNALLERVAATREATFIRNGTAHSAANAAEFLRRKCAARAAAHATARALVAECASASSTTGRPYAVRVGEGSERPSAEVLAEWLSEIESVKR